MDLYDLEATEYIVGRLDVTKLPEEQKRCLLASCIRYGIDPPPSIKRQRTDDGQQPEGEGALSAPLPEATATNEGEALDEEKSLSAQPPETAQVDAANFLTWGEELSAPLPGVSEQDVDAFIDNAAAEAGLDFVIAGQITPKGDPPDLDADKPAFWPSNGCTNDLATTRWR
jgi:hypothetical protein